jgi:hypothetical protein
MLTRTSAFAKGSSAWQARTREPAIRATCSAPFLDALDQARSRWGDTLRRSRPGLHPNLVGAGRLASWPWPRCQEGPAPRVSMEPPNEHPVVRWLAGAPFFAVGRGAWPPPQNTAAASGLTSSWGRPSWGQPSSGPEQSWQRWSSSVQVSWPSTSPRCSKTYLLESDRHESTGPCANSYQIF